MLKGIAEEIPDHLRQTIGVPCPAFLALVDERAPARGLGQEHFFEHLASNVANAGGLRAHRDAPITLAWVKSRKSWINLTARSEDDTIRFTIRTLCSSS